MNFNTVGDLIFNFLNTLVIIFFSAIFCLLTFSIFLFPLIVGIIVTIQDTFIYNKGYFYKTFFKTTLFVTKKYFISTLIFYLFFLIISYLCYITIFTTVPIFFTFSVVVFSSIFFTLLIISANISTLKIMKTSELFSNAILIAIKYKNFVFSILAITFLLLYIFLNTNILFFVIAFVTYIIIISYILEYGIIKNYRENKD